MLRTDLGTTLAISGLLMSLLVVLGIVLSPI